MINEVLGKITNKNLYRIMLIIFWISIVPIVMLAFYNYPCADDFSASDTVHLAWINTGSILAVIKAAWENVIYNYLEWSGVFMSVFWTSLQPGIFGEKYYGIITLLTIIFMIVGGGYLGHVVFDKYLKADKYPARIIIVLYLFVSLQCMPDGNEGLYWHAGVVNYTWAFSFLLMLIGLLLSQYQEKNKKLLKTILSCIFAIFVGGGNFITALQGCIWTVTLVFIIGTIEIYKKKKKGIQIIKEQFGLLFPTVVEISCFVISILAPGNKIRMESTTGFGALKSVLVSFFYFLTDPFEKWITWPLCMSIAIIIPLMWQITKKTKFSYRYPGLVVLMCIAFISAAYTPSLYAQGSAGAGRQDNTVFLIWVLLMYVVIFYTTGWLQMNLTINTRKDEREYCISTKLYLLGIVILWLMSSGLMIMIEEDTYIGSYAGYSILTGQAKQFRIENEERLKLLKSNEKNIIFSNFSNPPELLVFQDVSTDSDEWLNQVIAVYYGKESVKRKE